MYERMIHILIPVFVAFCGVSVCAVPVAAQSEQEETLGGPDSHETSRGPHGHLFGEWGGKRTRLLEPGVRFDFQYMSDSLWNIESQQERFASWNRFRWTVDIDFGKLIGQHDLYFLTSALWPAGGNLGAYLGLLTSPSGMSSMNTCRLDSWWIEKRWLRERLTVRAGQFAGQDFYGAQHYAASFIFEPMGYALGNLFTTLEMFDPPSTPAMEARVVPIHNLRTGWRVKRYGALTQNRPKAWMGRLHMTGAQPTSTATKPYLRRACDSTSRCLCQFTIQCRRATCKTV